MCVLTGRGVCVLTGRGTCVLTGRGTCVCVWCDREGCGRYPTLTGMSTLLKHYPWSHQVQTLAH